MKPPIILSLPAHRPMDSINMYLLLDDPITLIDAGLGNSATETCIYRALSSADLNWNDLQRVIVTHTHPDHVGLARRLKELSGADIYMHPLEWIKMVENRADNLHLYHWAGIPTEFAEISHPSASTPAVPDALVHHLLDGDQIPFDGFSLQVIHTPGHCSGMICLHDPISGCIFTSDHLVPNFSPALLVETDSHSPNKRTASLTQYQASLAKIISLPVTMAYPGHGQPFTQYADLIVRKLAGIPKKLDRIHSYLTTDPQNVFDIVMQMIPELPPALAFFACGDTLAYLDHLHDIGSAQLFDHNGTLLFSL